jgi:hypothetical protein
MSAQQARVQGGWVVCSDSLPCKFPKSSGSITHPKQHTKWFSLVHDPFDVGLWQAFFCKHASLMRLPTLLL